MGGSLSGGCVGADDRSRRLHNHEDECGCNRYRELPANKEWVGPAIIVVETRRRCRERPPRRGAARSRTPGPAGCGAPARRPGSPVAFAADPDRPRRARTRCRGGRRPRVARQGRTDPGRVAARRGGRSSGPLDVSARWWKRRPRRGLGGRRAGRYRFAPRLAPSSPGRSGARAHRSRAGEVVALRAAKYQRALASGETSGYGQLCNPVKKSNH